MKPGSIKIKNVTPRESHLLIQENRDNPDFVVIDVRTPAEYARGRIDGAINVDRHSQTFRDELARLDREGTYLIYCLVGIRSMESLKIMKELGFREVYNMLGGIRQWYLEGLPITWPGQHD